MKSSVVIWGLVLLVGFWASDYAVKANYSEAILWVAWAVILNLLNYGIGKTMKKTPKELTAVWMQAGVFGFLVSLVVAAGVIGFP